MSSESLYVHTIFLKKRVVFTQFVFESKNGSPLMFLEITHYCSKEAILYLYVPIYLLYYIALCAQP
jgi:hypothetical protein